MATISNTPRPGYVWDVTDNVWYPIGVGGHSHSEIASTIADAKGDLIAGTAADTVSRLAVGTNNYVLTADSAEATGLKWAAAAGGGKVLQVVSATYSTQTSTGSNTYIDSGLTLAITPTLNTSKVLVLVMQSAVAYATSAQTAVSIYIKLMRASTTLTATTNGQLFVGGASSSALEIDGVVSFSYLDSPTTTSATTYKIQFRNSQNAAIVRLQANGDELSTIILMEIGA